MSKLLWSHKAHLFWLESRKELEVRNYRPNSLYTVGKLALSSQSPKSVKNKKSETKQKHHMIKLVRAEQLSRRKKFHGKSLKNDCDKIYPHMKAINSWAYVEKGKKLYKTEQNNKEMQNPIPRTKYSDTKYDIFRKMMRPSLIMEIFIKRIDERNVRLAFHKGNGKLYTIKNCI